MKQVIYAAAEEQDVAAAVEPDQEYCKGGHTAVEGAVVVELPQIPLEQRGKQEPGNAYKKRSREIAEDPSGGVHT